MKRRINSVRFAGRFLLAIAVFTLVIPAGLLLLPRLLPAAQRWDGWLPALLRVSLSLGVLLLLVFAAVLFVEAVQDALLERRYRKILRRAKLEVRPGVYECQYCGSRKVQAADTACPSCGKEFA